MATIYLAQHDYGGGTIVGAADRRYDRFVGPSGDFNGDGFDDLLLGSGAFSMGYATAISVWLGGDPPLERGYVNDPEQDTFWVDTSMLGDINGDGFDDIAAADVSSGRFTVIMGRPQGEAAVQFRIQAEDLNGGSVAGAGDVNGDGIDDFLLGVPRDGGAYLIFGKEGGFANFHVDSMPQDAGFKLIGPSSTGLSISSAGDYNGDGFDDMIIGAPDAVRGDGAAYLVFGKAEGFGDVDLRTLTPEEGFVIEGRSGRTGTEVTSLGDINGDGLSDIALRQRQGAAYVVFGKTEGFGTIELYGAGYGFRLTADGGVTGIASAGDIDGDGLDDIIVATERGASVIFGKEEGLQELHVSRLDGDDGFTIRGSVRGDYTAAGVGDLNGDGFDDIVVGGGSNAHVIYGGARFGPVAFTPTAGDDTVAGGIRDDHFNGGGGNDTLAGRLGNDELRGGAGDDVLGGGGENDLIDGGDGNDTAAYRNSTRGVTVDLGEGAQNTGGAGVDTLISIENLVGSAYADRLTGDAGANRLSGGDGNDRIDGRGGDDFIDGGLGDGDTAIFSPANNGVRVSLGLRGPQDTNAGLDTLVRIENLVGSAFDDVLGGNDDANILNGGQGDDRLRGNGGNDRLIGGAGIDTADYAGSAALTVKLNMVGAQDTGGAGTDILSSIENITGGAFGDRLTGNGRQNSLDGGEGDDILDGAGGGDRLVGREGDDTFVVRHTDDLVIEAEGAGLDEVISRLDGYQLAANVEILTLGGTVASGTGNALDNRLFGNGARNLLRGGGGDDIIDGGVQADRMEGGSGDDLYHVDHIGDETVEAASRGHDTVRSTINWALAGDVEDLVLVGAGLRGVGNALANSLAGNAGANVLDGAGGADLMAGGAGDDLYHVDSGRDVVEEAEDGGVDTVRSGVSLRLFANVENLVLTGDALAAAGNDLANSLTGTDGANRLDGGGGADQMRGGAGDDVYQVDNVGDRAREAVDGGADLVRSSVSHTLGSHVETLVLTGDAGISGNGNGLGNRISGNSGDNRLNGAGGADELIGSGGDDRLTGGDGRDQLGGGAGYDQLTGDAGSDLIEGGAGNDILTGGSEDDSLFGGAGRDRLTGGTGSDSYYFDTALNPAFNVDAISDFVSDDDTIMLDRAVFDGIAADGTLSASAFAAGTEAADASDRIIYNSANGGLYYDADGSGAGEQLLFAKVAAGTVLGHADIVAYSGASPTGFEVI